MSPPEQMTAPNSFFDVFSVEVSFRGLLPKQSKSNPAAISIPALSSPTAAGPQTDQSNLTTAALVSKSVLDERQISEQICLRQ